MSHHAPLLLAGCILCLSACSTGGTPARPEHAAVACTQEARQCPDGRFVARQPPSCAFAPCPAPAGPGTPAR